MADENIIDGNGQLVGKIIESCSDKLTVWRLHSSIAKNSKTEIVGDWFIKGGFGFALKGKRVGNLAQLIAECYR